MSLDKLGNSSSSSASNNTTATLAGAATFTGTGEQNDHPDVMVSTYADVAGTLYFDFSINGTDWRTFPSGGFTVSAGVHEFHTAVKGPRHFRVRYVNGASAQATFQMAVYYGAFRQPSSPLNQAQGQDSDAIFVRQTNVNDEIIRGLRSGVTHWNKFCYRDNSLAASGQQTVWSATTNFTVMTASDTFLITYDGTGGGSTDGAGTTGALTLLISYLDANYELQSAVHTLGTDGSDTTAFSGLGINRVLVLSAGSTKNNVSAITISDTGAIAGTQAHIPAAASITQQSIFHVPISHTAIIRDIIINVNKVGGSGPVCTFRMYVYNRLVGVTYELFKHTIDAGVENTVSIDQLIGFPLGGRDVVYWTMDTSVNSTIASIRYSFNMYSAT